MPISSGHRVKRSARWRKSSLMKPAKRRRSSMSSNKGQLESPPPGTTEGPTDRLAAANLPMSLQIGDASLYPVRILARHMQRAGDPFRPLDHMRGTRRLANLICRLAKKLEPAIEVRPRHGQAHMFGDRGTDRTDRGAGDLCDGLLGSACGLVRHQHPDDGRDIG